MAVSTLKYDVVPTLKYDVVATLKSDVVSTLKMGCLTSRPTINLRTSFKQRCVPTGTEPCQHFSFGTITYVVFNIQCSYFTH